MRGLRHRAAAPMALAPAAFQRHSPAAAAQLPTLRSPLLQVQHNGQLRPADGSPPSALRSNFTQGPCAPASHSCSLLNGFPPPPMDAPSLTGSGSACSKPLCSPLRSAHGPTGTQRSIICRLITWRLSAAVAGPLAPVMFYERAQQLVAAMPSDQGEHLTEPVLVLFCDAQQRALGAAPW